MDSIQATSRPLSKSLQTLLFLMFFGACASRWVSHFGIGLIVAFAWSAAIGGGIAGVVRTSAALFFWCTSIVNRNSAVIRDDIRRIAYSVVVGLFGGVIFCAIGFAATTIGSVNQVVIRDMWFEARFENGVSDDQVFPRFLVLPAVIGSVAIGLACAFDVRRHGFERFMGVAVGTPLLTCTIAVVWALLFVDIPKALGPKFPLSILSVLFWLGIVAIAAAAVGQVVAIFWAWIRHAQNHRVSRMLLWSVSVALVLFVTEGAIRGWFREGFKALTEEAETCQEPQRRSVFAVPDTLTTLLKRNIMLTFGSLDLPWLDIFS